MSNNLDRSSETFFEGCKRIYHNSPSVIVLATVGVISILFFGPWSLAIILVTALILYGPWRPALDRMAVSAEQAEKTKNVNATVSNGRTSHIQTI